MTFTDNPPAGDTTPAATPPSGRGVTDPATEGTPPVGETAPVDAPPPSDVGGVGTSPDFTESGASPEPKDEPAESGATPEPQDDFTESGASPQPQDDFTESGASPEPDGEFNEPPPVPEVIDPNTDTVLVSGAIDESGTQTILLDRDGDGLFESRVQGVDLGDGTFKVVSEPELLDEPFSPSDFGDVPEEPPADAAAPPAPPDVPAVGDFVDPTAVDVVEIAPGRFEADLDGDGTNDVEFRGSVGDDGLIKVERIRPIGDGAEVGDDAPPDPAGNTGTPEINEDNAPPLVEQDPENPSGEPRPTEGEGDGGITVIDDPAGADAVDPGGPPNIFPPDPTGEGASPPRGLDENEEIQPDNEPDPVDRLRPDREPPPPEPPAGGNAPPGEVELDLPELYEEPPPFASGAGGNGDAPPPASAGDPATTPVDDAGVQTPEVPAAACEPETDDGADEPVSVNAEGDGDDAGLLERVADAVHDTWDDATDVVT